MANPDPPERNPDPIDPDVDLSVPSQRAELHGRHPAIIGAIAAGGVIGALARYQVGLWWPIPATGFPGATLTINVVGCLLIGILMVCINEAVRPHPLVRPFLGAGVLGGFTTFSTYSVDLQHLLSVGAVGTALEYLAATALGAVAATGVGIVVTRRLVRPTARVA
jgi:fluoride exporter